MGRKTFDDAPLIVKLLSAGTAACTADLVTFPLDTSKVRLQVQGEGTAGVPFRYRGVFQTVATIAREEGPKALYNGLTAGLQRQMAFASIRLGLYDTVKTFYQDLLGVDQRKSSALTLLTRICAGVTTGALAVMLAQPTDVVKVRFQAEQGNEKRYKSTSEAYKTIYKVEGVHGLWKGMVPNIARSAIVNVAEIVCYDMVKLFILQRNLLKDNIICHFVSAVIAGFATTVIASPVDVIKTRYMNSPPGRYKGAIHCTVETLKIEGLTAFFKGFNPSFARLVSWNVVLWITYEKLKYLTVIILNDGSDD